VITPTSTFKWFEGELKGEAVFKELGEEQCKAVFESLVTKAKDAEEEADKAAKRNRKKFVELLQKSREITAKTSFQKASKLLGKEPAWEAVDETTRRQCFDIFVDQLKIQSGSKGDAGDDDADGDDAGKKKEKKKEAGKKRRTEEDEEPPPPAKKSKKKKEVEEEEEVPKKKPKKK